jgi:hypothetical protein
VCEGTEGLYGCGTIVGHCNNFWSHARNSNCHCSYHQCHSYHTLLVRRALRCAPALQTPLTLCLPRRLGARIG